MTTYGHFTLKDYEGRKDNPFLEQHGRWYRITDTHTIRALDRVNYQAEECDAREVEAWLANQAYIETSLSGKAVAVAEPEPIDLEQAEPETDDFDSFLDELEESLPPADESDELTPAATEAALRYQFQQRQPSLQTWAREHGWAGVGRISKKLREAYKAEFGAEG